MDKRIPKPHVESDGSVDNGECRRCYLTTIPSPRSQVVESLIFSSPYGLCNLTLRAFVIRLDLPRQCMLSSGAACSGLVTHRCVLRAEHVFHFNLIGSRCSRRQLFMAHPAQWRLFSGGGQLFKQKQKTKTKTKDEFWQDAKNSGGLLTGRVWLGSLLSRM